MDTDSNSFLKRNNFLEFIQLNIKHHTFNSSFIILQYTVCLSASITAFVFTGNKKGDICDARHSVHEHIQLNTKVGMLISLLNRNTDSSTYWQFCYILLGLNNFPKKKLYFYSIKLLDNFSQFITEYEHYHTHIILKNQCKTLYIHEWVVRSIKCKKFKMRI
jgi:hypothetical protein